MYYLITMHNPPQFYNAETEMISPSLTYITSLTKSYIKNGKVLIVKLSSTAHVTDEGDWMVECPRASVEQLRMLDIHPFQSKKEAKEFAVSKQLKSFRYLKVLF